MRVAIATSLAAALCLLSACGSKTNPPVEVVIKLAQATGKLAKATILVDYSKASARPMSAGAAPACTYLLPHLSGTFSDDGSGKLRLNVVSSKGFTGPGAVAACRMIPEFVEATASTISRKLDVSIVSAFDTAGNEVDVRSASSGDNARASSSKHKEESASGDKRRGRGGDEQARTESAADARRAAGGDAIKAPPRSPRPSGRADNDAPAVVAENPAPGRVEPRPAPEAHRPPPAREILPPAIGSGGSAPAAPAPGNSQPLEAPSDQAPADDDYDDSPTFAGDVPEYEITVSVTSSSGDLGALQLVVSHTGNSGGFVGSGGTADCVPLVDALPAFNNPPGRTLSGGIISLSGMPTPGEFVRCGFRTRERLSPGDFTVTVTDAADPSLTPVLPRPTMAVTSVVPR